MYVKYLEGLNGSELKCFEVTNTEVSMRESQLERNQDVLGDEARLNSIFCSKSGISPSEFSLSRTMQRDIESFGLENYM